MMFTKIYLSLILAFATFCFPCYSYDLPLSLKNCTNLAGEYVEDSLCAVCLELKNLGELLGENCEKKIKENQIGNIGFFQDFHKFKCQQVKYWISSPMAQGILSSFELTNDNKICFPARLLKVRW